MSTVFEYVLLFCVLMSLGCIEVGDIGFLCGLLWEMEVIGVVM
jgi:hypothetical protein